MPRRVHGDWSVMPTSHATPTCHNRVPSESWSTSSRRLPACNDCRPNLYLRNEGMFPIRVHHLLVGLYVRQHFGQNGDHCHLHDDRQHFGQNGDHCHLHDDRGHDRHDNLMVFSGGWRSVVHRVAGLSGV